MQLRKYRWSRHYESAEEELLQLLHDKKIDAERWDAEPYHEFNLHAHPFDKQLWCAEGSVALMVGEQKYILQPGDALDLPAGTEHSAVVGFTGVVCYEAHSPTTDAAK
jgi:quercetin dioxygenase-like cupin family protein